MLLQEARHSFHGRWVGMALIGVMLGLTCLAPASALELNRANQAQLESLKGIGVEGSDRILAERAKGDFKGWSDFMARVKGVKHGLAKRFSNAGLTVNGEPYEASTGPAKPLRHETTL